MIRHPYYGHLAMHEQVIREQISHVLHSDPPTDDNETGHYEVWKPHNLEREDGWPDDFEWVCRESLPVPEGARLLACSRRSGASL